MSRFKYRVSKSFCETTPESREDGDHSDSGYVWEKQPYTLDELLYLIKSECMTCKWSRNFEAKSASFDGDWFTTDYTTGEDRQETIHVHASPKAIAALKTAVEAWDAPKVAPIVAPKVEPCLRRMGHLTLVWSAA